MKPLARILLLIVFAKISVTAAIAKPVFSCCATDETHIGRPDEHAPISIMSDHTHSKDSWMVSYRHMHMDMDGMRQGTDQISASDVFASNYAVTPKLMRMDMHMLGIMYGLTDKLTLTMMGNYQKTTMGHQIISQPVANMINGGTTTFTTRTNGIGDVRIGSLYRFFLEDNLKAHIGLGLSIPTGSVNEKDRTPRMNGPATQQLPAAMQLGSGTFDLLPSLTFVQQFSNWSYGTQINAIIRLENSNYKGYRLGNSLGTTTWAGYKMNNWVSFNTGLQFTHTGKLHGQQDDVNQSSMIGLSVPTAFNKNYGGEHMDILLGINCYVPSGTFKDNRIAIDVRLPLWQDLNGFQLETDSVLTIGWQNIF